MQYTKENSTKWTVHDSDGKYLGCVVILSKDEVCKGDEPGIFFLGEEYPPCCLKIDQLKSIADFMTAIPT